jgi:hypothetical protein
MPYFEKLVLIHRKVIFLQEHELNNTNSQTQNKPT